MQLINNYEDIDTDEDVLSLGRSKGVELDSDSSSIEEENSSSTDDTSSSSYTDDLESFSDDGLSSEDEQDGDDREGEFIVEESSDFVTGLISCLKRANVSRTNESDSESDEEQEEKALEEQGSEKDQEKELVATNDSVHPTQKLRDIHVVGSRNGETCSNVHLPSSDSENENEIIVFKPNNDDNSSKSDFHDATHTNDRQRMSSNAVVEKPSSNKKNKSTHAVSNATAEKSLKTKGKSSNKSSLSTHMMSQKSKNGEREIKENLYKSHEKRNQVFAMQESGEVASSSIQESSNKTKRRKRRRRRRSRKDRRESSLGATKIKIGSKRLLEPAENNSNAPSYHEEVYSGRDIFGKPIYKKVQSPLPLHEQNQHKGLLKKRSEPIKERSSLKENSLFSINRYDSRNKDKVKGKERMADQFPKDERNVKGDSEKQKVRELKQAYSAIQDLEEKLTHSVKLRFENTGNSEDCIIHHQKSTMDMRKRLVSNYFLIIRSSIQLAYKYDIEQRMWKNVFHTAIDGIRREIKFYDEGKASSQSNLASLYSKFGSILSFAQTVYTKLFHYFSSLLSVNSDAHDNIRHQSYYQTVNILGDLARYRSQILRGKNQTHSKQAVNYTDAKLWYRLAYRISPKYGQPWNQLALLAMSNKLEFDTCYMFLRSSTSKVPFPAREALLTVFHSSIRKFPTLPQNPRINPASSTPQNKRNSRNYHHRHQQKYNEQMKVILHKINPDVLFIRICAGLFTKIDLDLIPSILPAFLEQFKNMRLDSITDLKSSRARYNHFFRLSFILLGILHLHQTKTQTKPELNDLDNLSLHSQVVFWSTFNLLLEVTKTMLSWWINLFNTALQVTADPDSFPEVKMNCILIFVSTVLEYFVHHDIVISMLTHINIAEELDRSLVNTLKLFWELMGTFLSSLHLLATTEYLSQESYSDQNADLPEVQESYGSALFPKHSELLPPLNFITQRSSSCESDKKDSNGHIEQLLQAISDRPYDFAWGFGASSMNEEVHGNLEEMDLSLRISRVIDLGNQLAQKTKFIKVTHEESTPFPTVTLSEEATSFFDELVQTEKNVGHQKNHDYYPDNQSDDNDSDSDNERDTEDDINKEIEEGGDQHEEDNEEIVMLKQRRLELEKTFQNAEKEELQRKQ